MGKEEMAGRGAVVVRLTGRAILGELMRTGLESEEAGGLKPVDV